MTPRMTDHFKRAAAPFKALIGVEEAIKAGPLEPGLFHLVKIRASQINGCAYCIQMHTAEALQDGETHLRLHMLAGWHDSSLFTDRERAALGWTEALTRVAETHAPDDVWAKVEAQFSPDERAYLTILIGAINLWNRVQIGVRAAHAVTLPAERADAA